LAGLVWRLGAAREPAAELEILAQRELRGIANGSGEVDIRSGDPNEIQAWVKANSGIDIQLPDRPSFGNGTVCLIGARLLRSQKFPVAVISYRAGDTLATMLITDRRPGSGGNLSARHAAFRTGIAENVRLYSWSDGRDDFAIAFGRPNDQRQPCLLCHGTTPALIVLR
jgi:anti-sigma factor RsiW